MNPAAAIRSEAMRRRIENLAIVLAGLLALFLFLWGAFGGLPSRGETNYEEKSKMLEREGAR